MNNFLYCSSKAIKYLTLALCVSLFLSFEALGHGCQSHSYTPVDKTSSECLEEDLNKPNCPPDLKHLKFAS